MRSGPTANSELSLSPHGVGAGASRHRPLGARAIAFVDRHLAVIFPLPALCLVAGLMLYPLVYTLILSTRRYDLDFKSYRFVALAQYETALTSGRFWDAFARTFYFTALSVVASIILGMVMALILNREFRGARWARTCIPFADGGDACRHFAGLDDDVQSDPRCPELSSPPVRIAT